MPNTGDIASKIIAAMRLSIPNLDTSIGSPMRKMIDPFAEALSEAYVDGHLINYEYDIDAKIGGDLDDFCAMFGIARIPAQRSSGVVTFTRRNDDTAQTQAIAIPVGTQVVALTNPPAYAQTTMAAVMDAGQLTVDIPVQAISGGLAGNVPAGLITSLATNAGQITRVVNQAALSGGASMESDGQLRTRWKTTVFRSLAGTEAMYSATAMEVPQDIAIPGQAAVSVVNVLGSVKTHREQVQVTNGKATSTLIRAAYIYADNVYCGPDIDAGSFLQPGVHFSFTPSNPTNRADATATLSSLNASTMPDGFYDLQFDYVPQASRNDPANTRFGGGPIGNRIDIWHNGQKPANAVQSIVFSTGIKFSAASTSQYYNALFQQANPTVLTPPVNNIFVPLAFGPILTLPDQISVGGTTYTEGVDYWIAHRNDAFGYHANSLFGISWRPDRCPANGATFSVEYTYDRLPRDVQDAIASWRLVGTDARAHAGRRVPIRFHFAIVYDRAFDPSAVNTAINDALASFMANLGFGQQLQVSDVTQVVHNVAGVDNVRFLTVADDPASYAMCYMSPYATNSQIQVYSTSGRATDVFFADNAYPVLHSTRIIQKAANNFRSGT